MARSPAKFVRGATRRVKKSKEKARERSEARQERRRAIKERVAETRPVRAVQSVRREVAETRSELGELGEEVADTGIGRGVRRAGAGALAARERLRDEPREGERSVTGGGLTEGIGVSGGLEDMPSMTGGTGKKSQEKRGGSLTGTSLTGERKRGK